VMAHAEIGDACTLGQNVFVASGVKIGRNCKIQNNVSLFEGVILEDDVFCGPSMVFTNVKCPRSEISRRGTYETTYVEQGATLGANCTIVCGIRIGRHAFIAAGAVVTVDTPPFALMAGVPARRIGWSGRAGYRLMPRGGGPGRFACPETGEEYVQKDERTLVPAAEEGRTNPHADG
jgi:UDP-2-acetamido-3-amino-2,3-dideoxy-glucuronate N-acetyltransferase